MGKIKMTHLELEISNACNEDCIHCYRHSLNRKRGFLSPSQVQSLLEQAKLLGAGKVTITGGEALLNPYWHEIIEISNDLNLKISLLTNGTLLGENDIEFLTNITQLQKVQISFYSIEKTVHDSITRRKGSYEATLNAINLLQKRKLPFSLVCPIMKENVNTIIDTLSWCEKNDINISTGMFIFEAFDYINKDFSHRLTKKDIEKLASLSMFDNGHFKYIWGTSHKRDLSKVLFYDGATSSLCISGDGTIYPAIGWYEPIGNINTDTLSEVFYNHPHLKRIRSYTVADFTDCIQCHDSDFCMFCSSPHIIANQGELGKLDKEWCSFIALRKKIALNWRMNNKK